MPQFKILPPTSILSPLNCYSKKRLFEELSLIVSPLTEQTPKEILYALNAREACGSTICANMVGMPNAMVEGLESSIAVLAILPEAIPYNTIDADPEGVDIAFAFFFSKKDDYEKYEEILRLLYGLFKNSDLVNSLRRSWQDPYKLVLLLKKIDNILDSQIHPVVKPASVLDTITGIFTKLTESEDKNKTKEAEGESGESTTTADREHNSEGNITADDDELTLRNKVDSSEPLSVNAQEQLAQQEQLAAEGNKSDDSSRVLDAITGIFTKLTDHEAKNKAKDSESESAETSTQSETDVTTKPDEITRFNVTAAQPNEEAGTEAAALNKSADQSTSPNESASNLESESASDAKELAVSESVSLTGLVLDSKSSSPAEDNCEPQSSSKKTSESQVSTVDSESPSLNTNPAEVTAEAKVTADATAKELPESKTLVDTMPSTDALESNLNHQLASDEQQSASEASNEPQQKSSEQKGHKGEESSSVLEAITDILTKLTDFEAISKTKKDSTQSSLSVDAVINAESSHETPNDAAFESTNETPNTYISNAASSSGTENLETDHNQGVSPLAADNLEKVDEIQLSEIKQQDAEVDNIEPAVQIYQDTLTPLSAFEDATKIINQQATSKEATDPNSEPETKA